MTNKNNVVNIHGKEYLTVAGRVQLAHDACDWMSITSEVLKHEPVVITKTTVELIRKGKTEKEVYTGISASNPNKMIEKQSPYEVSETSSCGRALGFAGFGIVGGIATADEVMKATDNESTNTESTNSACTCKTTNQYHSKTCPARKEVSE